MSFALTKRVRQQASLIADFSKSGIVLLVAFTAGIGYLLGHPFEKNFDFWNFFWVISGVCALSAGASGLNQIQDRDIDSKMNRTKSRPLPSGNLTLSSAWGLALAMIGAGCLILSLHSIPAFILGLIALVSYNGLYTLWWKRKWAFASVPGAIPGALPVAMGYVGAGGNVFSPGCLYLFALMFYWQMPHFWVLALKYKEDYASGGVPTLSVSKGEGLTLQQVSVWTFVFVALTLLGPVFLKLGWIYFAISTPVSIYVLLQLKLYLQNKIRWIKFFLTINFALMIYFIAMVMDLWAVYPYAWLTS